MLYIFHEVCFSEGMTLCEVSGKDLDGGMEATIQMVIKFLSEIDLLKSLSPDLATTASDQKPLLTDRKSENSLRRNHAAGLIS